MNSSLDDVAQKSQARKNRTQESPVHRGRLWRNQKKVDEAAGYILSNWNAAKLRLKGKEGVLGSSTESHVSHALSDRMNSV